MGWRDSNAPQGSTPLPHPAPPADAHQGAGIPAYIPASGFPSANVDSAHVNSIASAWASATSRGALTARDSKRVLILFSGPYRRPDGLAAYLRQQGLEVTMIDNDPEEKHYCYCYTAAISTTVIAAVE